MDRIADVGDMADSRVICAECGLDSWDGKCRNCGGGSGLHPGSSRYEDVLAKRSEDVLAKKSEDVLAKGNQMPDPDSGGLNAALRHFQGARGRIYPGSSRAIGIARISQVLGWLVVAAGLIVGVVVMAQTESTGRYNEHPYVVEGAIILICGLIQGLMLVMVGAYLQARLEFDRHVGGLLDRFKTMRT